MFKKAELFFWNFTIRCMQKPSMQSALRKLNGLNLETFKVTATVMAGGILGLIAAYLLSI